MAFPCCCDKKAGTCFACKETDLPYLDVKVDTMMEQEEPLTFLDFQNTYGWDNSAFDDNAKKRYPPSPRWCNIQEAHNLEEGTCRGEHGDDKDCCEGFTSQWYRCYRVKAREDCSYRCGGGWDPSAGTGPNHVANNIYMNRTKERLGAKYIDTIPMSESYLRREGIAIDPDTIPIAVDPVDPWGGRGWGEWKDHWLHDRLGLTTAYYTEQGQGGAPNYGVDPWWESRWYHEGFSVQPWKSKPSWIPFGYWTGPMESREYVAVDPDVPLAPEASTGPDQVCQWVSPWVPICGQDYNLNWSKEGESGDGTRSGPLFAGRLQVRLWNDRRRMANELLNNLYYYEPTGEYAPFRTYDNVGGWWAEMQHKIPELRKVNYQDAVHRRASDAIKIFEDFLGDDWDYNVLQGTFEVMPFACNPHADIEESLIELGIETEEVPEKTIGHFADNFGLGGGSTVLKPHWNNHSWRSCSPGIYDGGIFDWSERHYFQSNNKLSFGYHTNENSDVATDYFDGPHNSGLDLGTLEEPKFSCEEGTHSIDYVGSHNTLSTYNGWRSNPEYIDWAHLNFPWVMKPERAIGKYEIVRTPYDPNVEGPSQAIINVQLIRDEAKSKTLQFLHTLTHEEYDSLDDEITQAVYLDYYPKVRLSLQGIPEDIPEWFEDFPWVELAFRFYKVDFIDSRVYWASHADGTKDKCKIMYPSRMQIFSPGAEMQKDTEDDPLGPDEEEEQQVAEQP